MKVLNTGETAKSSVLFHENDKKILSLLCFNARLPVSRIAKLVKLSRQSVEYRINVMEKNHLLVGSRTIIDISKLGYMSYHYFISTNSKHDQDIIIERAKNHPSVNVLISYAGSFNFELSIMESSPQRAQEMYNEIVKGTSIADCELLILLNTITARVLPQLGKHQQPDTKYLRNDPSFSKELLSEPINYQADKVDKQILRKLSKDATQSLHQIGSEIKLSGDAVSYRVRKLVRAGYIRQFRPVVDYSIMSMNMFALLLKTTPGHNSSNRFEEFLKEHSSVIWATKTMGKWQYLIYLISDDQSLLHSFISSLSSKFPELIQSYDILHADHEYKYQFMTDGMVE